MKLSNLRLGPIEPGEVGAPFAAGSAEPDPAPTAAGKAPGRSRPHIPPQFARPPLDFGDPLAMGIEPRRLPGWVLAVAIGAVVVIAAGGLVAVLSLVDDRAMVPSSTAHTASPVPAIDRTSEIPGNAESWMAGTRSLPGMAAPVSSADRMPEELPRRDPAPQPDPAFQPQPAALAPLTPASNTAPTNDVERTQLNPSMLIARGDEFLANSDVSAARLFYRRAFDGGSAAGAAAMGATYDPLVLEQRGLRGVHPDPAAALQWYRTAAQQGSGAADARGLALIERLRSRAAAGDGEARAALERALP